MPAPPPPPPAANYNMQAGIADMVAHGLSANVSLSGTVTVGGISTPVTGSGTYVLTAGAITLIFPKLISVRGHTQRKIDLAARLWHKAA